MNFCIYSNYEISVKNEYCYINEDGDHQTETETFTKIIDGGKLAEVIASLLKDNHFSSFSNSNDKIIISLFDPTDGPGHDIVMVVKETSDEA